MLVSPDTGQNRGKAGLGFCWVEYYVLFSNVVHLAGKQGGTLFPGKKNDEYFVFKTCNVCMGTGFVLRWGDERAGAIR